jgi:hypothetical protein
MLLVGLGLWCYVAWCVPRACAAGLHCAVKAQQVYAVWCVCLVQQAHARVYYVDHSRADDKPTWRFDHDSTGAELSVQSYAFT